MRGFACGVTLALCLALPGLADAPAKSLRPQAPPQSLALAQPLPVQPALPPQPRLAMSFVATPQAPSETSLAVQAAVLDAVAQASNPPLRPRSRPDLRISGASEPPEKIVPVAMALVSVPRPEPRPRLVARAPQAEQVQPEQAQPEQIEPVAAVRILPGKSAVMGKKGSVCGDPAIRGETLSPITSRVRGCGIENPVRITAVDGITLSQSAVINCDTARALKQWIKTGLKPAFGRKDVVGLRVAASYACRPRNNIKGAKISEHGRGNALDISAIILANGKSVSVAEDWRRSAGKPMKKAYRAACGTFGTTLSPDADRYHRDHMHFDIANQRGGAYCR